MPKCNQCGNQWESRKMKAGDGAPTQCPACKRPDWGEPKKKGRAGKRKVWIQTKESRRKVKV